MELKSLIYTSWAKPGLLPEDVDSILESARINNPLQGLSGVLIFNGAQFMQILEGVEPAIDELVARLKNDQRHSNISVRDDRRIERRSFASWSMAYVMLENGEFVGEAEIERLLQRDLPEPVRNMIRGMTHAVTKS